MKRGVLYQIFFLALFGIIFILFMHSVSAYTDIRGYVQQSIDAFVGIVEPILQTLFGGSNWNSAYLFEKLLIYLILVPLVFLSLKNIPAFDSQRGVLKLIAFIVPLIGVRYLDYAWIESILFQYQILAIALAGFLPFVLFFFFIHNIGADHDIVRKIGWIFFIGVYFGLWSTAPEGTYTDIYFWTMVAAVVFLLFDNTIQRYFIRQEMHRTGHATVLEHLAQLMTRRDVIASTRGLTQREMQIALAPIEKQIRQTRKQIGRIP